MIPTFRRDVFRLAGLVILALATGKTPAGGQEVSPDTTVRLDPLRVTVTRMAAMLERVPFAVSAATLDSPVPGRGTSLAEVVGTLPGVLVQDRRNFSLGDRVSIRGVGARSQFGVRGVQVVVDGIPLTLPDGQSALGNLDLASAGRVEVMRGPASALYGNSAGGVIRVTTREPGAAPLAARAGVTTGSHGFVGTRLEASGRTGRLVGLASLRRVATDGFREYAAAENWNANLVARLAASPDTELRGVLNLAHLPFAENPSSLDRETARSAPRTVRPFVVDQGAGETHTQFQSALSVTHRVDESREVTAAAWGRYRSVWNPIPATIIDLSRHAAGVRAAFRGDDFAVGVDAALQHDERVEFVNEGREGGERAVAGERELDQRERVLGVGPFGQATLDLSSRWSLTLAGRYDISAFDASDRKLDDGDDSGTRTFTRFSPMAGVAYRPTADATAFANFSTAFETPPTSELSNDPDGTGGFNDDLRPEVLRSFEAGVRGRLPGASLSYGLAAYVGDVDDAIVPFQGEGDEVFFRNAGRGSRDGIELEVDWTPTSRLGVSLAYTFQNFVLGDRREPGVPRHRVAAGLRLRLPSGLGAELDATWVDAFPVDDANRFTNWAHRVVDVRFTWEGRAAGLRPRPFVALNNLFDERYNDSVVPNAFGDRYYEPAPGREFIAGLRVELPVVSRE
ncbi:MAG: TonB-dependent receptor [Gemmatimonadota bacterium]